MKELSPLSSPGWASIVDDCVSNEGIRPEVRVTFGRLRGRTLVKG